MPHYFFNIHNGVSTPDLKGWELPSHGAACAEAVRAAGEMLRDRPAHVLSGEDWRWRSQTAVA